MLNIVFHGAAQTTTGSLHEIQWGSKRLLLDCGLFQGRRKEAFEKNRHFPFDPRSIDAVILSHAHIDHSGNLPSLVRQGFRGAIYCTPPTRDLCDVMLRDSAFLQARDIEVVNRQRVKAGKVPFELLYTQSDVDATMRLFRTVGYHEPFTVFPGLTATLHDAGHILGAATVCLDYARGGKSRRLLFTGDIGQGGMPIATDPEPVPNVNVLLTESTYGDRLHPPLIDVQERLNDYVRHIVKRRSKLVIPAFSVGRTQQLLYYMNLLVGSGQIPPIPVIVDSPLSLQATQAYALHRDYMSEDIRALYARGDDPFAFPGLRFTQSLDESKALNAMRGPMVIISASGMCEGGRILHHIKNVLGDSMNIILFVGFQAESTLGRRIMDRVNPIRILGEEFTISSTVFSINALSGHADAAGLKAFYESLGGTVQQAFCIHGEPLYCEANAKTLQGLGIPKVAIPVSGQRFENV